MIRKVVACLLRATTAGEPELLVFTHPAGTVQIPKGTLEPGEAPEAAVLRELQEESGVANATIQARLSDLRVAPPALQATSLGSEQLWHVFLLHAPPTPDVWTHRAVGSPEEEGLVFAYEWLGLSTAEERLDPLFHTVLAVLRGGYAGQQ